MTHQINILFLLSVSLLLIGCEDSEYQGLKDDFSIKKIPYENIRKEVNNYGIAMYYTIDLKQDYLTYEQSKKVDIFIRRVLDSTVKKTSCTSIAIWLYRDNHEYGENRFDSAMSDVVFGKTIADYQEFGTYFFKRDSSNMDKENEWVIRKTIIEEKKFIDESISF